MGLFGGNKSSIDNQASSLNNEIASLEEQIRHLKKVLGEEERNGSKNSPARPSTGSQSIESTDPQFEPVNLDSLQDTKRPQPFASPAKKEVHNIQRDVNSTSVWKRFLRLFRGPTSSNPKLVSYLAAGNIDGMRALRYEKRVHRNRTILWVAIILVALIGLVKMLIQ